MQRSGSNDLGTDHRFTGQKADGTGLMYYNARYYDPEIGQFISPDSIVPDPTNVFAYNRYMYVYGNPLKYSDPSGHCAVSDDGSPDRQSDAGCWRAADEWFAIFGRGGEESRRLWTEHVASSPATTEESLREPLFKYWAPLYSEWGVHHVRYNPAPQMHPVTSEDQAFEQFMAEYAPDCQKVDCIAVTLDVIGLAGTGLVLISPACGPVATGCYYIGTIVGNGASAYGTYRTYSSWKEGDATVEDLIVSGITATAGFADPIIGIRADLVQTGWDILVVPFRDNP